MNKKLLKITLKARLKLIWQHLNSRELDDISKYMISYGRKNNISCDAICDFKYFMAFCSEYIASNITLRKQFESKLGKAKHEFFSTESKAEQKKILLRYSKRIVRKNIKSYLIPRYLLKTLDIEALSEKYNTKIQVYTKRNAAVCRILKSLVKDLDELPIGSENPIKLYLKIIFSELKENIPDFVKNELVSSISALLKISSNPEEFIKPFELDIKELSYNKYTWFKCSLLKLNLITCKTPFKLLQNNLKPDINEDFFVREFTVNLFIEHLKLLKNEEAETLINMILNDPAPFVRQALAFNAHKLNDTFYYDIFNFFIFKEEEISVKCSALKIYTEETGPKQRLENIYKNIEKSLFQINNSSFLRYALHTVDKLLERTLDYNWSIRFIDSANKIRLNYNLDIPVRRFAANIKEKLWCYTNIEAFKLLNKIKNKLKLKKTKNKIKFSPKEFEGFDDESIGRVLAVIAQNNFTLDLKKGYFSHKLFINSSSCFRWWRFIYELLSPSPEKRQTVKHTTGRLFKGNIRANSYIMSEQSETKIPGEPLFINEEGSSRPYLPLPDEIISAAEYGKEVKLFSSEGVTTVIPPKNIIKRFWTELIISLKFKKLAKLRNWQRESSQESPASYVESIRKLGFSIQISPFAKNRANVVDKDVNKFFLPAAIPLGLIQFFNSLKIYFLSLYENTVYQLSVFIILLFLFITGRHWLFNLMIHKARKSIPLVIGGWGTRGKSGTERIKAALFSALGCNVISKTTGCEAMFLHTPSFGKTQEMFLFRPYDKATIWEQFNLLRNASKLGADVFLWECMALSPPYVRVLQHDWMRDNYSTITNTYPDHEDLQGPAGWNIAETMTNFIPKDSVVFTSEEQMHPILEIGAVKNNTEFISIDKFNTILLTPDILARFPYEEHPYNITLVLKMALHLGLSRQFILKEMADNVVPDIGVLKRYKDSNVCGRNLEFFSGMSANERFGCLTNWERMKFSSYGLNTTPDVFVATVVNNRADRIARSKVFAQILIDDISADKHFLIGNNLEGLRGYIKDAWDAKMESYTLSPQAGNNETQTHPKEVFTKFAVKLRIPVNEEQIKGFLSTLLKNDTNRNKSLQYWNDIQNLKNTLALTNESEKVDIVKFYEEKLNIFNKYYALYKKLDTGVNKTLEDECKTFFWDVYKAKLVIVSNYYATGNEVIKIIAESCPVNFNVKIMALQNIKGTGLDFFYRWQAWENFNEICDDLYSENIKTVEEALTNIAAFTELDILWLDKLKNSLNFLKNNPEIIKNYKNFIEKIDMLLNSTTLESYKSVKKNESGKLFKFIMNSIENFLDPGDAVSRRKRADKIYSHLIAGRISSTKAIKELQYLTKRQKGGWLRNRKK